MAVVLIRRVRDPSDERPREVLISSGGRTLSVPLVTSLALV